MIRRIAISLAAAVVFAAGAFVITRAVSGDKTPRLSESVEPNRVEGAIGVAIPVIVPGGDIWAVAVEVGASEQARREAASAAGEVIEDTTLAVDPDSGYGFPEMFDFDWGEVYSFGDDPAEPSGEDGEPAGPGGGDSAAAPGTEGGAAVDGAVDACAGDEPPDDCPEGVPGTVLAIRTLPPLAIFPLIDPVAPGTAPYVAAPECPPVEPARDRVSVGVSTNRPAEVTLSYWPYLTDSSRPSDEVTTVSLSTSDTQTAVWTTWAEDEAAGYDDPRYWIDQCFVLDDLAPGQYAIEVTVVDELGSGDTVRWPHLLNFSVTDESGEVPTQERRPTVLFPWGVDRLFVSVTREPAHLVVVRAFEVDGPATCDTGGDPGRVLVPDEGADDGVLAAETVIPATRRRAADYPYLPDHSFDATYALDLAEGTDYLVCIYWVVGEGRSIDLIEAIPVSTPDAYTPRVILHGFDGLIVSPSSAGVFVRAEGCIHHDVDLGPGSHPGPVMIDPLTVCGFDRGLAEVDVRRGFSVRTSVVWDGETLFRTSLVRTGPLECRFSPCLLRLNEVVRVPLPEIVTERRLCGSGWGSGCDDPIPRRTAGYAVLEIVYDRDRSNGVAGWVLGSAGEAADTPPEQPRVTVSGEYEPTALVARFGVNATVLVSADRPVDLRVEVVDAVEGREPCFIWGRPEPYVSTERREVHAFSLYGLCVGERYELLLTGSDEAGNELVVVTTPRTPPGSVYPLYVHPAAVTMTNEVTVRLPDDFYHYTVNASLGSITVPRLTDLGIAGGGEPVRVSDCIPSDRSPVVVRGTSWALTSQTELHMTADVQVRRNRLQSDTVFTDCSPLEDLASYHFEATVTLADLWAGVTITSEDGLVTYTIRAFEVLAARVGL